jgi:hypothetical protein
MVCGVKVSAQQKNNPFSALLKDFVSLEVADSQIPLWIRISCPI